MTPVKPFETYKWRWLSVAPTESLLEAPVFLGVLRVLARHEGQAPTTPQIMAELNTVQTETGTPVNLARTSDRNIIRNSGQYWKGTGLLLPNRGLIHLTSLGTRIAEGRITQGEFAAIMVQQTVLPNPWTYESSEIDKWQAAGLQIRPLALILETMIGLGRRHGNGKSAFLTARELINVVIPLAGMKVAISEIVNHVVLFRQGQLDLSEWPDCAPAANDHRLAREFLLFLSNFGLCRRAEASTRLDDRYHVDELFDVQALATPKDASIFEDDGSRDSAIMGVIHSSLPSIIDRQRVATMVLRRSGQAAFRDRVIRAYGQKCFLTGEVIPKVLEAAHIVPVAHGGSDGAENGICLRVDVHRLFDAGDIRVKPTGDIMFSDEILASSNYGTLPPRVVLPPFVNPANVHWRDEYY